MKKQLLSYSLITGAVLCLASSLILLAACSDRNAGAGKLNTGDIRILNQSPGVIKTGFSAVKITPDVPDRWVDKNGNSAYEPDEGDSYTDGNGNGKFDPVWIAGFDNKRAANGINDDLWARTMIVDDGRTRIAIVSLDVIGFMNNAVNDVRSMISPEAGISYLIVTSTHSHEGPDLLGLWGSKSTRSGVNKEYMEFVKKQIVKSVEEAAINLRPSRLEISEDLTGAAGFHRDSRTPEVFDSGLRVIKAVDSENNKTIGTLVSWGNHPETLWGKNLLITSDFPHYLRESVEKGIFRNDSLIMPGLGGTVVYSTGSVGGLMTTSPGVAIPDPITGAEFKEPTFDKAKAQGEQLAILVLTCTKKPAEIVDSAAISIVTRSIKLPLSNRLFKLAKLLKVLDRGGKGLRYIRTELAVFTIGPLSFATIPGEVYPEIINGGIESPEGNDYNLSPVEVPSVRDMMPGKYKFILGLANDEIGYIIPKSQWDEKSPYTYGRDKAPYGEENSMGPETAPELHRNLKEILEILKN
jgi:hypothetical protein